MNTFKLTSCMAENADFFCHAVAGYLSDRIDAPIEFINDIPWQQREQLLDAGQIQVCWICGLPYVWKADLQNPHIELLAAPVMREARYENRPVYFSEVVVHRDSHFQTFADLRGASWAYNEPYSHSGYNVVKYHLATLGETSGYFGRVIESGAHQTSLDMILNRQIDASAIDSTVFAWEAQRRPEVRSQLRFVETLGPSPIPPWVILRSVDRRFRNELRDSLLDMHENSRGRRILTQARVVRFVPVTDHDYDPIRDMERKTADITL